jgi:hypothetical protein
MHSIFLSFILLVYLLYYSKIKVVDATVHFEHGKVIQCEIKPGSVERSIDLGKRGYVSAALAVMLIPDHQ